MKYFFDTEFSEMANPIELISIGIVAEDGRELYGTISDFNRDTCNEWVKQNVLTILHQSSIKLGPGCVLFDVRAEDVAPIITEFVGDDPFPEFWAWYGHYDWFLLTRLFKTFDRMPKNWPHASLDVYQFRRHACVSHKDMPVKLKPEHNALVDARWTKLAYETVYQRWHEESERRIWP